MNTDPFGKKGLKAVSTPKGSAKTALNLPTLKALTDEEILAKAHPHSREGSEMGEVTFKFNDGTDETVKALVFHDVENAAIYAHVPYDHKYKNVSSLASSFGDFSRVTSVKANSLSRTQALCVRADNGPLSTDNHSHAEYADAKTLADHLANHPSGGDGSGGIGVPEHEHDHKHEEFDQLQDEIDDIKLQVESILEPKTDTYRYEFKGENQYVSSVGGFSAFTENKKISAFIMHEQDLDIEDVSSIEHGDILQFHFAERDRKNPDPSVRTWVVERSEVEGSLIRVYVANRARSPFELDEAYELKILHKEAETGEHKHEHEEFDQLQNEIEVIRLQVESEHTHDEYSTKHDHPYVKTNADTDIKPTADNRFITLVSKRPKEEDGSYADKEFGLEVDIDEGNTWKNQFVVGNRNGFALKVLGGGGRTTWFGGKITQKGDSLENEDARDYIIRKNLNDAVDPLLEKIEHNQDVINALEHELEAIAETKEAGEWELVSILDFDVRGTGQMTLSNDDFTASNNEMTLHETDKNGLSHGFSGVEVGDLVEVVEEHISRATGDYGLYEVKAVNGMSFTLELQQGRGQADLDRNYFVKFFHLSDDVNLAELDARYSLKGHTHPPVPSPKEPPGRPFVFGDASKAGEFYADNEGNVYFNRHDLNGILRVMPTYPDFSWSTPCKITLWNEYGYLKYASEAGKSTNYETDTIEFTGGKKLYNKGLTAGETYWVTVEGYW